MDGVRRNFSMGRGASCSDGTFINRRTTNAQFRYAAGGPELQLLAQTIRRQSRSIGRTLAINGHRFSIVGVCWRGFHGLSVDQRPRYSNSVAAIRACYRIPRGPRGVQSAARLKPEHAIAAQTECLTIWIRSLKDRFNREHREESRLKTVSACLSAAWNSISRTRHIHSSRQFWRCVQAVDGLGGPSGRDRCP